MLAYMTEFPKNRLVWLDRTGRETAQVSAPDYYGQLRLSPDGQKAALTITRSADGFGRSLDPDLTRDTRTRFVSGATDDRGPSGHRTDDGSPISLAARKKMSQRST